jgi:uncharacterized phage protein (TIGR02220 family)
MIIDPDFLDHWKTRMLVDMLDGDENAPLCVIRLWAHCQNRREWNFEGLSARALKAICRYTRESGELINALKESSFISIEDGVLTVNGWEEYNASLIANWSNGKKGGRPRKQNPSKTHGLPMENPSRTDKIGLDKIGLDKIPPNPQKGKVNEDAKSILEFLNKKANRKFRAIDTHLEPIRARLKESGVTVEGVQEMISAKCDAWLNDSKMSEFLRPGTLFAKTKFASYYDLRGAVFKAEAEQSPELPPAPDGWEASRDQLILECAQNPKLYRILEEACEWSDLPGHVQEMVREALLRNPEDLERREDLAL